MNIAGNFDSAQEEMLHEAGFQACYVMDISNGDTIAIDHRENREVPTEMVVEGMFTSRTSYGDIHHWLGVLPSGRRVHCSYNGLYPVWRLVTR